MIFVSKIKYIPIINKSESCKLAINDICYVSRSSRKVSFETENGKIYTYYKIDNIDKILGPEFTRCMSSCIVNMSKIKDLKDNTVFFENGQKLKLGRDSFVRLKQKYNVYLLGLLPSMKRNK